MLAKAHRAIDQLELLLVVSPPLARPIGQSVHVVLRGEHFRQASHLETKIDTDGQKGRAGRAPGRCYNYHAIEARQRADSKNKPERRGNGQAGPSRESTKEPEDR